MTAVIPVPLLTSDPFFPRLKALVIESTGMAFYADKDEDLARIVGERLAELGLLGCAAYLELLTDAAVGKLEMDALVAELTIGETYFFRHREQFDALKTMVLPDIIERNRSVRRLRIWSAGCATGPEPYSIAMMLRRDFGVQISGWHVSVIGTDINQKFLARAREGRFDEWAFRATSDEVRAECFLPAGRQWEIRPEFKSMVTFQYHNLIKSRFPSLVDNIASFDVVICRNVVIYFSQETIAGLIPRFRETLVDGGWLLMGHAEPNQEMFRDFRTIHADGAVLYQKPAAIQTVQTPFPCIAAPPPRPVSPPPPPPLRVPERRYRPRPAPPVSIPAVIPTGDDPLADARRHADHGRWEQAAQACQAYLAAVPLDARGHFLSALIHEQTGQAESCEAALRRAIYLDRRRVLPHYQLGLFLLRRDDAKGAARSFRNVLTLLESLPEEASVADGDGLTVGQLRETVTMQLKLIGGA